MIWHRWRGPHLDAKIIPVWPPTVNVSKAPASPTPFKALTEDRPTIVGPFKNSDMGRPTSNGSFEALLIWPSSKQLGLLSTSNSITRPKKVLPWAKGPSIETSSQLEDILPLTLSFFAPLADTKSKVTTSLSFLQQASPTLHVTTTFADYH